MRIAPAPVVSFVVACTGWEPVPQATLGRIGQCGLRSGQYEVVVLRQEPRLNVSDLRGEYVVLLREDSLCHAGCVGRMIGHFEDEARLGAAVFTEADGKRSGRAAGCPGRVKASGTGVRRAALQWVRGLPAGWPGSAAEMELSVRLAACGWKVQAMDDLMVTRGATGWGDLREEIGALARYLPVGQAAHYARDVVAIGAATEAGRARLGLLRAFVAGAARNAHAAPRLAESLSRFAETERRMRRAQDRYRLRRILLVDLGQNMAAYWEAARRCDLEVAGIADGRRGSAGRKYRGVPVLADEAALRLEYDAAVVSNGCPREASGRRDAWRQFDRRPVIDLFEDDALVIRAYADPIRLPTCGAAAPPPEPGFAREVRRTVARSA